MKKELYYKYPEYYYYKYEIVDSEETYEVEVDFLDRSTPVFWAGRVEKTLGNIQSILEGPHKTTIKRAYRVGYVKIIPKTPYIRILKNNAKTISINDEAFLAPTINLQNYEDILLNSYGYVTKKSKTEDEAFELVQKFLSTLPDNIKNN